MSRPKIISVDFDGVLHSYTSGWQGVDTIPDLPVDGAIAWLSDVLSVDQFHVVIFSARSCDLKGIDAMKRWLLKHGLSIGDLAKLGFPQHKPSAFLSLDDRAITFRGPGTFPTRHKLATFEPWWKR